MAILVVSVTASQLSQPAALAPSPPAMTRVGGIDYLTPNPTATGCPLYTWLRAACYTNATLGQGHISPRALFASDMTYMRRQHLGAITKVWVSLDELFKGFDPVTGYHGYDPQALSNTLDMLHILARHRMKANLELFTMAENGETEYTFHAEALDGNHPKMRAGYLRALRDFLTALKADPLASRAVASMDLMVEGYYQLDQYFYNRAHLGIWNYQEPPWPHTGSSGCLTIGNTVCTGHADGHGCVTTSGGVDTTCINVNIMEPWFKDLYTTAHAVAPQFAYTISDIGNLLTTDTSPYNSQAWWIRMYPVDVYDIHLYADNPMSQMARWATGRALPHPWYAGDVGNKIGNLCTWIPTCAVTGDRWWIQHLDAAGATEVLVDNVTTVWHIQAQAPLSRVLTVVGRAIAAHRTRRCTPDSCLKP